MWIVANGQEANNKNLDKVALDSPSKIYAVPLLLLLSTKDISFAGTAATALARVLSMYPGAVQKNIVKLCDPVLAVFPAPSSGKEEVSQTSARMPYAVL